MFKTLRGRLRGITAVIVIALTLQIWLVNLSFSDVADLLNILYLFAAIPIFINGVATAIKIFKKYPREAGILMLLCTIIIMLFLTARFSYNSRRYITDHAGPAGPDFTCITWDESDDIGYNDFLGTRQCVYYYTPELNKFWFDQSPWADSEYGFSSYASLTLHLSILLAIYRLSVRRYDLHT